MYIFSMGKFIDDQNCFVCGKENLAGFRLVFRLDETRREAETEVVFPAHLQGWKGTVHGGALATVLDEVMVQAARAAGLRCVTAEITVKYRNPAATGVSYLLSGRVLEARGRLLAAEGWVRDASGQIYAQATGKLFRIG